MATDWRFALSASSRYENVERIARAVSFNSTEKEAVAQQEAFGLESQAFDSSSTREEYDEACDLASEIHSSPQEGLEFPSIARDSSSPGFTIGNYTNCTEIDEGVTSTVYYSPGTSFPIPLSDQGYALKVVQPHPPEPHNPTREIKTLQTLSHEAIVPLFQTFRGDDNQHILVFPFKPLPLPRILDAGGPLPTGKIRRITRDILSALAYIHDRGIIHRDIKPSGILLDGPDGQAYLSDFGTAWHPKYSSSSEPPDSKILDIGTGPYRPPDALLGNKSYSTPIDIWSFGVLLSELTSLSSTLSPIFTSPPTHEDGSQLGLILSIFRTLGTPTPETWPEAANFRTTPFGMWRMFEREKDVFAGLRKEFRGLVEMMLKYESRERVTAKQALNHECLSRELPRE